MTKGILINYDYCTGCHSCEVACKKHLGLPEGEFGIKLTETGPYEYAAKPAGPERWEWTWLLINARSVFAYLLLAMGGVLGALGLFFLVRAIRAPSFCARRLDRLLAADFEASRSETKRVFDLIIDGEGVETRFGVTSGVPQRRRLRWDQVRGVYLADGLVFVQGLTWVCRASTPPDAYDALVAELRRRMPPDLVVEVGAARLSD